MLFIKKEFYIHLSLKKNDEGKSFQFSFLFKLRVDLIKLEQREMRLMKKVRLLV